MCDCRHLPIHHKHRQIQTLFVSWRIQASLRGFNLLSCCLPLFEYTFFYHELNFPITFVLAICLAKRLHSFNPKTGQTIFRFLWNSSVTNTASLCTGLHRQISVPNTLSRRSDFRQINRWLKRDTKWTLNRHTQTSTHTIQCAPHNFLDIQFHRRVHLQNC